MVILVYQGILSSLCWSDVATSDFIMDLDNSDFHACHMSVRWVNEYKKCASHITFSDS